MVTTEEDRSRSTTPPIFLERTHCKTQDRPSDVGRTFWRTFWLSDSRSFEGSISYARHHSCAYENRILSENNEGSEVYAWHNNGNYDHMNTYSTIALSALLKDFYTSLVMSEELTTSEDRVSITILKLSASGSTETCIVFSAELIVFSTTIYKAVLGPQGF